MLLLRELDGRLRKTNDVKSPRDEGKVPAIDFEEIDILETKLEPLQPTPVQGDDPPQIAFWQFQLVSGPPVKAFLKSHIIRGCKEVKLVGEEVGAEEGEIVGAEEGEEVGAEEGEDVGAGVGVNVGRVVGANVGALVGLLVHITVVPKLAVAARHGA